MLIQDRRRCRPHATPEMLAQLNAAQRASVTDMEQQGWKLQFVRREPMRPSQPVLIGEGNTHLILSAEGEARQAAIKLRT